MYFLINIIFRDIHQFLSPGHIEWVIAGELFGTAITDGLMLYGGFAVEVKIVIILLPWILTCRMLRIVNGVAAVFTAALILFTPPIEPDDVFFLIICLATLLAIVRFGWARLAPARQPV